MGSLKGSLSFEKEPHHRDVSFSSYLNPSDDAFLRKLVETSKIPSSTIALRKENVHIGKKKEGDGEIGVFNADKYFNGGIDEENIDHQHAKNQQSNLSSPKEKIQNRTPSVRSQSSWNSQRALLQSGRKNSIRNKNGKWNQGKSLLSTLSCSCSCGDKNSVDIDEHKCESFPKRNFREEVELDQMKKSLINPRTEKMQTKKIEDSRLGSKTEDFTFPIVNPDPGNSERKQVFQDEEDEKKIKPSKVLDSPVLAKEKECSSLEIRLDLFTLDINPRPEEIDNGPNSNGIFEGFESESSSDLFEIESFSTTNNTLSPLKPALNVSSCATRARLT